MPYYTTEAIVINSIPLCDTDKIVYFLTPYDGLVKGVVRMCSLPQSFLGSAVELLSCVEITFSHKEREFVKVKKIDLKESHFQIISRLEVQFLLAKFARIIFKLVRPAASEPHIYSLLKACIKAIKEELRKPELIELYFYTWSLKLSGYWPRWFVCNNCNQPISERAWVKGFLIVCNICFNNELNINNSQLKPNENSMLDKPIKLEKEDLLLIKLAIKEKPQNFVKFAISFPDKHIGKVLKTMELLLQSIDS